MNKKGEICIGMAGAGRATELHMNALKRYTGVPVCYKHIIARREEQVKKAKEIYGYQNYSLNFQDLLNEVSKCYMYDKVLRDLDYLKSIVEKSEKKFMYAMQASS